MTQLERLIQPASPVYDPDDMTRQLLFSNLKSFFEKSYIAAFHLDDMRGLVRDFSGQNQEKRTASLPTQLNRLSSVKYHDLSAVNCRQALKMVLNYVGLDDTSGPDLLGVSNWMQVLSWVEEKVAVSAQAEAASVSVLRAPAVAAALPAVEEVDAPLEPVNGDLQWSRKALANAITSLLKENHRMLAGDVERVRYSINKLREALRLEPVGQSIHDVGFSALSSMRESNLAPDVMAQVPQSIMEALGLDAKSGPQVLGQEAWADVQAQFAKGWVGGAPLWSKSPVKDDASSASEHAPGSEPVADEGGVLSRLLWNPIKRFFCA